MNTQMPTFRVSLAETEAEMRAVQQLRYNVFVKELGGDGPLVDHKAGLERDHFDPHAKHLVLRDKMRSQSDQIVGVYRLMTTDEAKKAGQFYCEDEYDLSVLRSSGKRLLELGRSCLHRDYRGGPAMMHLWSGLADYVAETGIELLFGVASFHGTDITKLAEPLSLLKHKHLAPPELRVTARSSGAARMDIVPIDQIDRVRAMRETPALIKAYLRLGGFIGEGAYVDRAFNTVDLCLILPTNGIDDSRRSIYARGAGLD